MPVRKISQGLVGAPESILKNSGDVNQSVVRMAKKKCCHDGQTDNKDIKGGDTASADGGEAYAEESERRNRVAMDGCSGGGAAASFGNGCHSAYADNQYGDIPVQKPAEMSKSLSPSCHVTKSGKKDESSQTKNVKITDSASTRSTFRTTQQPIASHQSEHDDSECWTFLPTKSAATSALQDDSHYSIYGEAEKGTFPNEPQRLALQISSGFLDSTVHWRRKSSLSTDIPSATSSHSTGTSFSPTLSLRKSSLATDISSPTESQFNGPHFSSVDSCYRAQEVTSLLYIATAAATPRIVTSKFSKMGHDPVSNEMVDKGFPDKNDEIPSGAVNVDSWSTLRKNGSGVIPPMKVAIAFRPPPDPDFYSTYDRTKEEEFLCTKTDSNASSDSGVYSLFGETENGDLLNKCATAPVNGTYYNSSSGISHSYYCTGEPRPRYIEPYADFWCSVDEPDNAETLDIGIATPGLEGPGRDAKKMKQE